MLMGQSALSRIRPGKKIGAARGMPFWQEGRVWIPTYHPAYILRNRSSRRVTETDIKLAFDIAYGRNWKDPVSASTLSDTATQDLSYALDEQGYAVWDSGRIGDRVVVARDELVKVPAKHSRLIRYTVEELVRIGELGKGETMPTDALRKVHLVKSLGGTIVR